MASVSYSNKKFVVVSAFTYIHTYVEFIMRGMVEHVARIGGANGFEKSRPPSAG